MTEEQVKKMFAAQDAAEASRIEREIKAQKLDATSRMHIAIGDKIFGEVEQ